MNLLIRHRYIGGPCLRNTVKTLFPLDPSDDLSVDVNRVTDGCGQNKNKT
jgi:hypothetical protein